MNQERLLRTEIYYVLNRNHTEKFLRRILTVALAYEKVEREAKYCE